tara:strand:- start:2040 stop:2912 length:873 start_codon:yes stop_codon:yes gene_type:complete
MVIRMSIRTAKPIEFPPAYPNMFVQPLESFLVNGSVEYNADILALGQEEKEWVGSWALTEIFDMTEFSIITDCYELLNDERIDVIDSVEGDKKAEEAFSVLDPNWLMDLCMKSWEDVEDYHETLEKSREYLNENYIIESKVLIFPTEVFGPSEKNSFTTQSWDYMALKFWQLNNKRYEDLSADQQEFIGLINAPLIVFMGLFKLNLTSGVYQIPANVSNSYNPTGKAFKANLFLKNYERDNRLYLAVNRAMEDKNKLDMSVIRKALKYNLVDGKIGIMNIDSVTYEIKKL